VYPAALQLPPCLFPPQYVGSALYADSLTLIILGSSIRALFGFCKDVLADSACIGNHAWLRRCCGVPGRVLDVESNSCKGIYQLQFWRNVWLHCVNQHSSVTAAAASQWTPPVQASDQCPVLQWQAQSGQASTLVTQPKQSIKTALHLTCAMHHALPVTTSQPASFWTTHSGNTPLRQSHTRIRTTSGPPQAPKYTSRQACPPHCHAGAALRSHRTPRAPLKPSCQCRLFFSHSSGGTCLQAAYTGKFQLGVV
jgi:hypothetical protein